MHVLPVLATESRHAIRTWLMMRGEQRRPCSYCTDDRPGHSPYNLERWGKTRWLYVSMWCKTWSCRKQPSVSHRPSILLQTAVHVSLWCCCPPWQRRSPSEGRHPSVRLDGVPEQEGQQHDRISPWQLLPAATERDCSRKPETTNFQWFVLRAKEKHERSSFNVHVSAKELPRPSSGMHVSHQRALLPSCRSCVRANTAIYS